jgi:hypothetical protein
MAQTKASDRDQGKGKASRQINCYRVASEAVPPVDQDFDLKTQVNIVPEKLVKKVQSTPIH